MHHQMAWLQIHGKNPAWFPVVDEQNEGVGQTKSDSHMSPLSTTASCFPPKSPGIVAETPGR